jgi:periplasmic divalent cation tolerance protein
MATAQATSRTLQSRNPLPACGVADAGVEDGATVPRPPASVRAQAARVWFSGMLNATEVQMVFCTVADNATGRRIANALVENRLAACVNLLPGLESTYRWQGQVEHDSEALLLIKVRAADYAELEAAILALHPYELPEIIAVPIKTGQADYLKWIHNCLI